MERQPLNQNRFSFEQLNIAELTASEFDLFTTGYTVGLYQAKVELQQKIDDLETELALERITVKRLRDTFNRWPYRQGRNK